MRIYNIFLAGLAGIVGVNAAPPVISNIQYSALTHTSIRWQYQVSNPNAFAQIKYGVTSGVYPYQSASYGLTANWAGGPFNDGMVSLALGGLAPNTTYYFRMAARPNATNDTDICQTDDCGSVEQVVTTPAEPTVNPASPEPPLIYQPNEPDTTGYVVVPMAVSGNGTCVAASTVSAANVSADDSLQVIINNIGYGTILEFPQGAECKVPPQPSSGGAGYLLPYKNLDSTAGGNIDSPDHRWIIWRTASNSPADFPPFGSRTTPAWSGKMAKLIALTPHNVVGQILTSNNTDPHHWWFQNLEFTHTSDPAYIAPDSIDPVPFVELIQITPLFAQPTPPRHIVLDRLYVHGTGFPGRVKFGLSLGGMYQAMIGCYVSKIDFWRMAKWTTASPTTSNGGTVLNVPVQTIRRNINDPDIGMTAPATVTISNGAGYTGTALGILGQSGLTIQYTNGSATLNCTNCTAVQVTNLGRAANQYAWFTASIANGQFLVTSAKTQQWDTSAYGFGGSFGVQLLDHGRGPYLFDNNFIDGYGLSFYVDPGGGNDSNDDVTWVRNHQIWNQDHRPTSPTWNGFRYDVRQLWEIKRGKRYLLKGNIFEGNWSYQNNGPSIFLSSRPAYTLSSTNVGVSDVLIRSNIIRHAASGWSCMGSSPPPPDSTTTQRVLFENNLLHDINRYVYDDSGPSFSAAYMDNLPGCQDVNMRNNTMGLALGRGPYLMLIGGGAALGGRLNFTDNIMYMSFGEGGGGIGVDDNQFMSTHPRLPGVNVAGTIKQKLDTFFVKTGATVQPNYSFTNNVIIGGMTGTSLSNLRSLTSSEMADLAAQFPPGNIFPPGATMAERQQQVGMVAPGQGAYRLTEQSQFRAGGANPALNGKSMGADLDQLDVDLGKVLGINIQPGSTALEVNYTAPDGRACSVDSKPAASGSWTRTADQGGARPRTVIISGLTPATSYQYRILCYYEQLNDGSSLTGLGPGEVTNGAISTTELSSEMVPYTIAVTPPDSLPPGPALLQFGTEPDVTQQQGPVPFNANGYEFTVQWLKGTALYYRVVYLDAANFPIGALPIAQAVIVR
ncbi:MAG: hypothetical protein JJE04_22920 [Acidobacteriia bacterium]|nr:hypothetical protein [Terriglobia bacterium]